MELLLLLPWIAAIISIALSLYFYTRSRKVEKTKLPPEAAGGRPILGHSHLLAGPEPEHITLANLADKFGPIFTLRLGRHRALIVSSSELAKECFKTNDVAFSDRQRTAAVEYMGYNFALLVFSNYGLYWRVMRKTLVQQLLSNKKVDELWTAREAQTMAMMRRLKECGDGGVVDMKEVFGDMILGLMCRTVAGDKEKLVERSRWKHTLENFFKWLTAVTISDVVPWLKWMDKMGGAHEGFKRTGRDIDSMLQTWLDGHKESRSKEDDFLNEILSLADSLALQFPSYDADTISKATCQSMMVGGTDTSSVTLTWALTLLLNNRHTLKKAQEELDHHVGPNRQVQESDIEKLVYLQAIVKETLRLHPPIPLTPRAAGEDCVVAGYHIPKGTWLLVNTWKIHRDPRVWPEPLEFKPERFLTSHKDIDVLGFHYELLPFGGGRRVCPAISFALRAVHLALATFLHGFDVDTPSGGVMDVEGGSGATIGKATPLEVCLKPRVSPELYV